MRFHQPVGVVSQSGEFISEANNRLNPANNGSKLLNRAEIKTSLIANRIDNINNLNSNKTTTFEDILKLKPDSRYFNDYFGSATNVDLSNGNDGTFLIETLNFCDSNLVRAALPRGKSERRKLYQTKFDCLKPRSTIFVLSLKSSRVESRAEAEKFNQKPSRFRLAFIFRFSLAEEIKVVLFV